MEGPTLSWESRNKKQVEPFMYMMMMTVTFNSTTKHRLHCCVSVSKWLRERATLLRCTYIAYVVESCSRQLSCKWDSYPSVGLLTDLESAIQMWGYLKYPAIRFVVGCQSWTCVLTLPDWRNLKLPNFVLRQFFMKLTFLKRSPNFYLRVWKLSWDDSAGRILLGDNTVGGAVTPRPIGFHRVGVLISSVCNWTCVYSVPTCAKFCVSWSFQNVIIG